MIFFVAVDVFRLGWCFLFHYLYISLSLFSLVGVIFSCCAFVLVFGDRLDVLGLFTALCVVTRFRGQLLVLNKRLVNLSSQRLIPHSSLGLTVTPLKLRLCCSGNTNDIIKQ